MKKRKKNSQEQQALPITVALAGNPNVGKSTLFNSLTGMHVHTGNWAGKTVGCESALAKIGGCEFRFVDIPGTYSLASHSEEERIARDFICFGEAEVTVVVCDASSLMQNLNLLLQISETGRKVILALNFVGAAERQGIKIDVQKLSLLLDIPVVAVSANKKRDMIPLCEQIVSISKDSREHGFLPCYTKSVEDAIQLVVQALLKINGFFERIGENRRFARWIALTLIDPDGLCEEEILSCICADSNERSKISDAVSAGKEYLFLHGVDGEGYRDARISTLVGEAERIASAVTSTCEHKKSFTERADKLFTGRVTAYPVMLLLLALVFWITLSLANYPSELLSHFFELSEEKLYSLFYYLNMPPWITGAIVGGLFRTLGRVVAVMLPPMAIFFPLFSILEDSGYLPRIAYNLDRPFACAGACGKQALTMCMGFGCNAVGIVGCRIIDSKRERLLAILTNSLVPCNGRLPMLVTLISVLFIFLSGTYDPLVVSLVLTAFILLGILATFVCTAILSKTLLRGERSSFTIELPPYRRPQILNTIYRSLVDRCGAVLARAVLVAAPLGLAVWILANISIGDSSILTLCAEFLNPVGQFFGLDGVILLAFIIGIPANEIVLPLMLMMYTEGGAIGEEIGTLAIGEVLSSVGWTPVTAICTALFALFHFPCSTSLITVYKETKSKRITLLSFIIPTLVGLILCFAVSFIFKLII